MSALPVAIFARVGVGLRVPFPLIPRVTQEPAKVAGHRSAPATVLTWGPFRIVCVWGSR